MTPGTEVDPSGGDTIVIRPGYSKGTAQIIYLANGGQIATAGGETKPSVYFNVTSGASIETKIDAQHVLPTRVGYSFKGWKLINGTTNDAVNGYVGKDADGNLTGMTVGNAPLVDVATTVAKLVTQQDDKGNDVLDEDGQPIVILDKYYLVAQWEVGNYTLRFDANGGSLGNVRSIEDIAYGTDLNTLNIPISGRGIPSKPGYIFQGWSESSANDTANVFKIAQGVTGITAVPAPTMPASDKTIYAVWKVDTSKFVVHFDSNGGSKISDQAYLGSSATKYDTFLTPQRAGYTFAGWYKLTEVENNLIVNELTGASQFKDTEAAASYTVYVGGETIQDKTEHTFIAMWTPRDDTKYTVDYFINSGSKDKDGNYIYNKVTESGVTKTYTGTTESKVAVPEEDKVAELTVEGVTYWYNAANAKNVLEGDITGSPTLSLRLYYDRYLKVIDEPINCTIEGDLEKIKEGGSATVTWTPNDGYEIKSVWVDNVIRDDLLTAGTFTFDAMYEDHAIKVICAKVGEKPIEPEKPTDPTDPDKPTDPTDPTDPIDPTQPDVPVIPVVDNDKNYKVSTALRGIIGGSTITPTTTLKEGDDHKVTWELAEGYYVVSVEVDGNMQEPSENSIKFTSIQTDHKVVVTLGTRASLGGGSTPDYYTVTVNKYGQGTVSPSKVVEGNVSVPVTWTPADGYKVESVYINGEKQSDRVANVDSKNISVNRKNWIVDVYFAPVDPENPPIPVDPDRETVNVTVTLVGAKGDVEGREGGLEVGANKDVTWTLDESLDTTSDDYVYYEVEKVTVNGEEVPIEEGQTGTGTYSLNDIQTDQDVVVYAKAVNHNVAVQTSVVDVNTGTVTPANPETQAEFYAEKQTVSTPKGTNLTLAKTQDCEVKGTVKDTELEIAKIRVDGVVVYSLEVENAPETQALNEAEEELPVISEDEEENKEIETEEEPVVEESADENVVNYDENIVQFSAKKLSTTSSGLMMAPRTAAVVSDEKDVNGVKWEWNSLEELTANDALFLINEIGANHRVEIFLVAKDIPPEDLGKVDEIIQKTFIVTASVEGVANPEAVTGTGTYKEGDPCSLAYTIPEGYQLSKIFVNGEPYAYSPEGNSIKIATDGLAENYDVRIVVVPEPPQTIDRTTSKRYHIATDINGGEGGSDITASHDAVENSNDTITWTIEEGYSLWGIEIDGKRIQITDEMRQNNAYTFDGVASAHDITVLIGKNNVDTTGDGKPDTNIDTDDDGIPDTNVDTDGDGKLDINIDTDGDGEPDVNIDTDGDGEPDINIVDKDGDGKPDPIDPKDIDPDNPIIPDIDVDTDGDGEPDVNIDTDGDGKPDINIDTDGDGKPDIDIDTDGDGEPDINIDTDGDGDPDINIVDKDGDGEPDPIDPKDIDPENPIKPNINVDIDGDGKPDRNVDVDGDGKADVNIVDEDGDGIPDAIEQDENGNWPEPNVKVDKDGNGIPDEEEQQSSGGSSGGAIARPQLNKADHFAYMVGYPEGTFLPGRNMTRAEVTVMFSRLLEKQMTIHTAYGNSFSDVPAGKWYSNAIGYMEQYNIVRGYPDGTFRPDAPVTRAEFAAIAARFSALKDGVQTNFSDLPDNHWAKGSIELAYGKGWIGGYPDGTVRPDQNITRAEVVAVTNRMLERAGDANYIAANSESIVHFTDLNNGYWAYYDIMEACNAHLYKKAPKETWTGLNK